MIIGIGCDIVDIRRIEKAMRKEGFLKILSEHEITLYEQYQGKRQAEWLAGRFAAKEAIFKAVHAQFPCVLHDIEVLYDEHGAPVCTSFPSCIIHISISHENDYAIAYAMAEIKE